MFVQSAMRAAIAPETTFRVMVVGEAGLGKSTLIACLLKVQDFGAELEIYKENQGWQRAEELPGGESTLKMRWYRYHFTEMVDGVSVRTCFEIIDTPGFASQINSNNSWVEKLSVIEKGFQFFRKRKPTDRSDSRVHLALYVLPPQPRPLKELDKRVMAELQCCVPLLPVIAKADTFDSETLKQFQASLRQELQDCAITTLMDCETLKAPDCQTPLAIIASNKSYRHDKGKWEPCGFGDDGATLGRLYRWGLASCEDSCCSDLPVLRRILLEGRKLVLDKCDAAFEQWDTARHTFILEVARALACIEEWRRVHKIWWDKPCCAGPEPLLDEIHINPNAQHLLVAEEVWEEEFDKSLDLAREMSWHCRVTGVAGGQATSEWLKQVYEERYSNRLEQLLRSARIHGEIGLLRELLMKSMSNGALYRIVVHLVERFIAQQMGHLWSAAR